MDFRKIKGWWVTCGYMDYSESFVQAKTSVQCFLHCLQTEPWLTGRYWCSTLFLIVQEPIWKRVLFESKSSLILYIAFDYSFVMLCWRLNCSVCLLFPWCLPITGLQINSFCFSWTHKTLVSYGFLCFLWNFSRVLDMDVKLSFRSNNHYKLQTTVQATRITDNLFTNKLPSKVWFSHLELQVPKIQILYV